MDGSLGNAKALMKIKKDFSQNSRLVLISIIGMVVFVVATLVAFYYEMSINILTCVFASVFLIFLLIFLSALVFRASKTICIFTDTGVVDCRVKVKGKFELTPYRDISFMYITANVASYCNKKHYETIEEILKAPPLEKVSGSIVLVRTDGSKLKMNNIKDCFEAVALLSDYVHDMNCKYIYSGKKYTYFFWSYYSSCNEIETE